METYVLLMPLDRDNLQKPRIPCKALKLSDLSSTITEPF
ncbi:unnamed protein product, partial [Rotaria sp. Silwood2]